MAKKPKKSEDKKSTSQAADNSVKSISVEGQYIKDLSFENPGAPGSFQNLSQQKVDLNVDIKVAKLAENSYEVTLVIQVNSKSGEDTIFIVELSYSGIFSIQIPEQELQPILMVYCPNLLFPYVRRILSDVTRDGGLPPLMLDPIDFSRLYMQHIEAQKKK